MPLARQLLAEVIPRPWSNVALEAKSLMTELQLTLLQGSMSRPGSNIIRFVETYHADQFDTVRSAWMQVIDSEPMFRTLLSVVDGKSEMTLSDLPAVEWKELTVFDKYAYESELSTTQPMDNSTVYFKVVTCMEGLPDESITTLVCSVHHAKMDGYSMRLLHRQLRNALQGKLPSLGRSFTDIAQAYYQFQEQRHAEARAFWQSQSQQFDTAEGTLTLPIPSGGAATQLGNDNVHCAIDAFRLRACAELGVSFANLCHAAWSLVLSVYTDSEQVVTGVVLSGRDLPIEGIEDTVGPGINTLPLYTKINPLSTMRQLLSAVFEQRVQLTDYQTSRADDGMQRQFSTALAEEYAMGSDSGEETMKPISSCWSVISDVPLVIYHRNDGNVRFAFDPQRFRKTDVRQLVACFENAIGELLQPSLTIGSCLPRIISPSTRRMLMQMGNCLSASTNLSSVTEDLVTLFDSSATRYPQYVAVRKGDFSLTYQELEEGASHIAAYIAQHAPPGSVVCVHADRSVAWIMAIYGILKAGAVYSPLDPALPEKIRQDNFTTARAVLFIVPTTRGMSVAPAGCTCLSVEELLARPTLGTWRSNRRRDPSRDAYICFTSGSTGKPKGVVCTHAGLVAFQRDITVRLSAAPGISVAQTMSPAFDGSIHEIFSTLSYGATLVLKSSADPFEHIKAADSAIITPSVAKSLDPADFSRLKTLYLVGEAVPQAVNDMWTAAKDVYNMYGPTEGTGGATIQRLMPGKPVTIGRPNPSSRIYILSKQGQLMPPGAVGEICLAGVQIARGYIGRREETAKRFVPDHILANGETMYHTGDRGYWNSYGEVCCLGRQDRQIKLRGFRMDLNDLETRLSQAIPEATMVAIAPNNDHLIAIVQPASIDPIEARTKAAEYMPVHCVPRHIMAVDKFPMTPIGKVDYKAIVADFVRLGSARKQTASTMTPFETAIAKVWREVLGLSPTVPITPDSNFIALGGHSVLQMLLASKLTAAFKCPVSLRTVTAAFTLGQLAHSIAGTIVEPEKENIALVQCKVRPDYEHRSITPMEEEWWEKYESGTGSSSFNVSYACNIDASKVDILKLVDAWDVILDRHQIFRTRFVKNGAGRVELASVKCAPKVRITDSLVLTDIINRPFDLASTWPVRVVVSQTQMVVCISHIICDLTSFQVMLAEQRTLYSGLELAAEPAPFIGAESWKQSALPEDLHFWGQCLSGSTKKYLFDKQDVKRQAYSHGTSHIIKVPHDTFVDMLDFTSRHGLTLHQLGLAAVGLAASVGRKGADIVLGAPYLNRQPHEMETVGLFLEPLPIRVKYASPRSKEKWCLDYCRTVQGSSQSAIAHAVPWDQLLRQMRIKPEYPNHTVLDVMVTFHDNRAAGNVDIHGLEPLSVWAQGSKFVLLVEFCALANGSCIMRVEHDTDVFPGDEIVRVEGLILKALRCLTEEMTYSQAKHIFESAEVCRERLERVELGTELRCI